MTICAVCRKKPHQLSEYKWMAKQEDCNPEEFVKNHEGTYNPEYGTFYCTKCYCDIGYPLGLAGPVRPKPEKEESNE